MRISVVSFFLYFSFRKRSSAKTGQFSRGHGYCVPWRLEFKDHYADVYVHRVFVFCGSFFFFLDCLSSADDGPFLHFSPRQSHFHTTGTEWQKKKTKKTIRKQVAGNSVLALKKARIWERCRLLSVADVFLSPVEIIYKQFPNNLKWRTTLRSTMCVRFSTVCKPQRRWRLRTRVFFFRIRLFNTVTSS